jgi:hypothetical protein
LPIMAIETFDEKAANEHTVPSADSGVRLRAGTSDACRVARLCGNRELHEGEPRANPLSLSHHAPRLLAICVG